MTTHDLPQSSTLSDDAAVSRPIRFGLIVGALALGVHGLIEVGSLALILQPAIVLQHFAFDELNGQPAALAGVGVVMGLLRLLAAGGILRNRIWGWGLGVLLSVITFTMLTLYLPAGMADAILSGTALFDLLVGRYGSMRIFG